MSVKTFPLVPSVSSVTTRSRKEMKSGARLRGLDCPHRLDDLLIMSDSSRRAHPNVNRIPAHLYAFIYLLSTRARRYMCDNMHQTVQFHLHVQQTSIH